MYECRERVREATTRERQHAEARAVLAAQVCSGMITPPIVRDPLLAGCNVMNNTRRSLSGIRSEIYRLASHSTFCSAGRDCSEIRSCSQDQIALAEKH